MDAFSDLDLLVLCAEIDRAGVMRDRTLLAGGLGPLVAAFTGEHVGEPRLLICLYGPPALHVDLKIVTQEDVPARSRDPIVLWQRDGAFTQALSIPRIAPQPMPDAQWIEDRFWVWVHDAALKIERGELQQALDFLSYLRVSVLGPLGLQRHGLAPHGVRRVESIPQLAAGLATTIGGLERGALSAALQNAVRLYLELRPGSIEPRQEAQQVALDHLQRMASRLPR